MRSRLIEGEKMSHHNHVDKNSEGRASFDFRFGVVLLAFLAIGAFLLFSEHRAHVLGSALWLLILACPLLHIFMHGSHGEHGSRRSRRPSEGKRAEHQH